MNNFKEQLNDWGHNKVPFLFLIDFELQKPKAWQINEISSAELLFEINGFSNAPKEKIEKKESLKLEVEPSLNSEYKSKFSRVMNYLNRGDSFVTNLTIKTKIHSKHLLRELFYLADARYKIWYKERFLVFSPEIFIQIRDQKIFSFPMKGTIDATIPQAKEKILADQKELAEHVTIVDLLRNDLSSVASSVKVKRFRYVEKVKTSDKNLLQISSQIQGNLPLDYSSHIGDILFSLLPAGSVSGAPKVKTCQIIQEVEGESRGYYTGIVGYFDGVNLDSGVMIRYIEKAGNDLFFRSGGGITTQSNVEAEYQEALDKIYVPIY
ncbi:MAG: aminodeoxychorismate synthase component I [Cyclobacteriaceae bacterium]|nr:aminodeoxychorismate synthase component I [Cyclobacteriaceae bacterium]